MRLRIRNVNILYLNSHCLNQGARKLRMKAKRVRFKDSENDPNHPENCRFEVCSAEYEAREDLPLSPAASNEPKTSEFSFFKKLKKDFGRSSCRKPVNRESIPVKKFGPNNHSRDLGESKKAVESSQYVRKSTTGELCPFLSPKNAAVEVAAMPSKEHDRWKYKSSSFLKTPISMNLELFLPTTENASVNPESQQNDGDIFSSKRLKLMHWISKTLFPDANEVPKECNLVLLLLSRLLPESSQETLSQTLQLTQPETKEKCELHLDSNLQLGEASNTRKLVKANEGHFLDRGASATQSHRFWETLPSGQTVDGLDVTAARYFDKILLVHEKGNEQRIPSNAIAYGYGSERFGDRNLLPWGNELYDYSTTSNTSPNILKNESHKQFLFDDYDRNWSCRFRDYSHLYEVNGNYDSSTAANSSSLVYKGGIHDFNLDRGLKRSPSSWCDAFSHVSLEKLRPSAFSNLRDYTEPNCLNDFGNRREFCPRLIGWNTDELHVHDSTKATHMEIEIYHPPSSTCDKDLQDTSMLEIYRPPYTWSEGEDPCVSLEKRNLLHMSPYTHPDIGIQGYNSQPKDLAPRSPYFPLQLPYGPQQLNPDDYGLSISRGSNYFYIPQKSCRSMENMICERKSPAAEAFPHPWRLESNSEFKCNSLNGFLAEQYGKCTDDVLELFRLGYSSSESLIANENNMAKLQPEHLSMTSVHVPIAQEDFLPLQLQTLKWKDTEAESCDDYIPENSYYLW